MSESKLSLTTLAPMLSVRAVKVVIPLDPHELSRLAAPEGQPRIVLRIVEPDVRVSHDRLAVIVSVRGQSVACHLNNAKLELL